MSSSEITSLTALEPSLEHLLAVWMPRQRWYPAKGRGVGLRQLGGLRLGGGRPEVDVEVHVLGLDSGDRVDVVQVPLTLRGAPLAGAEGALVGEAMHPQLGRRWVYDGTHDPAYVAGLLRSLEVAPGAAPPDPDAPAKVLSGEQSNTSIIIGAGSPGASIVKVFRTLHPGANPDVEVTAALAGVGCDRVAKVRGWGSGTWTATDGSAVEGHLAVAVEFLAGSEDAWREAVAAVESGTDFAVRARELGAATASVHLALAEAFGRTEMSPAERERMLDAMRARVEWALTSAPALEPFTDALSAHGAGLSTLGDLPALQRIHGDYHLGQVLHSPSRGWILLDFEGEPLRPLSERTVPDLALRDVAGMLRSFDYAARFTTVERADSAAAAAADEWARSARTAFCAGYAQAGGDDPSAHADLLAALELDKALYEVVYETRNRPAWLPVPLHAVERLLRW
jgi:trehalose synthase-fused probable maltokinase